MLFPDHITDCDRLLPPITAGGAWLPSAADVFGEGSRLVAGAAGQAPPAVIANTSVTGNIQYQILVLALFVLFCIIVYDYRNNVALLFSVLLRKKASADKIFDEQNSFFKQFIALSLAAGALLIGGVAAQTTEIYGLTGNVYGFSTLLAPWFCWVAVGIAGIITFYKIILIKILGTVTANKLFFEEHHSMSRSFFVAATLTICPLFLISALGRGALPETMMYVLAAIAGIAYLVFLGKSYKFFSDRNVSFLQWILYLCAVEFFPVSFLLLSVTRNFAIT